MTIVPSKINGESIRSALFLIGIPNRMEEIFSVEIGLRSVVVMRWDRDVMPPVKIRDEYPIVWGKEAEGV